MTEVVECKITCALCGLTDLLVYIPVRKKDQDIVDWMNTVFTPKAVEAHEFMSPGCKPKEFTVVKIPVSTDGFGISSDRKRTKSGERMRRFESGDWAYLCFLLIVLLVAVYMGWRGPQK